MRGGGGLAGSGGAAGEGEDPAADAGGPRSGAERGGGLEQALPSYDRQEHPWKPLASSPLLGGLAGALSYLACAPLDLARVRMASDLSPGPAKFGGFAELCSAVLWRH